ncbi:MAG: hypothetical protein BIFFINMI_02991 [Phycisphaerae bacterium]|nr:hypothetical protein [Phycisphaerae bacterium]
MRNKRDVRARRGRPTTVDAPSGPRLENLESRLLLSTVLQIGVLTEVAFTDSNGDAVTVAISGSKGKVTIEDSTAGALGNGDEILSMAITGASKNFAISVRDGNAGGSNDVALGAITSNSLIKGVYTVAGPSGTTFNLDAFTGPGFAAGGGLRVTNITGGGSGEALVLRSLDKNVVIDVLNNVSGDVTIARGFDGRLNVGGAWGGNLEVGGAFGKTGLIALHDSFIGDAHVRGNFQGMVDTWEGLTGAWTIDGSFLRGGQVIADTSVVMLTVGRGFDGIWGQNGSLTAAINGVVGVHSVINAEDLTLETGTVAGGTFTASDNLDMTVNGSVNRGTIASNAGGQLTVHGSIQKAEVAAEGTFVFNVDRDCVNSIVLIDGLFNMSVTGQVRGSTLFTTTTATEVFGATSSSKIIAYDSLDLTVNGALRGSSVAGTGVNTTAVIHGGVDRTSEFAIRNDLDLTVDGDFGGRAVVGGTGMIHVLGSVLAGAQAGGDDDVTIRIEKDLNGTVGAENLDLYVGRNVLARGTIEADNVKDLSDADIAGLYVGGYFAGRLNVQVDLTSGTGGGAAYLVLGDVKAGSMFNVLGSLGSAPALGFGGNILGTVSIGTLDTDLTVDGSIRQMVIGSEIDHAITVGGKVFSLTTGSRFVPVDALTGNFEDGAGNITGSLTTGSGYVSVLPI